jgi:2'-5' RNA ligase
MKLFIGIEVPLIERQKIAATFKPDYGLDFVPIDKLHLTLRFIGNREMNPLVKHLFQKLEQVKHPPFNVIIQGTGVFPQHSPHIPPYVLWANFVTKSALCSLKAAIDTELGPDGNMNKYGGYNPHLTLAKPRPFQRPGVIAYMQQYGQSLQTDPWTVDRFVLFGSHSGTGLPYEKMGEFLL